MIAVKLAYQTVRGWFWQNEMVSINVQGSEPRINFRARL